MVHCHTCVRMMREQYQEYDEDYRRKNAVSKIKIRESPKKTPIV